MKVLVCGDRKWTNKELIMKELSQLPSGTILVHGYCTGADILAAKVAEEIGFEVRSYPAKWSLYGNYAGPKRNIEMLDKETPDLVIAFHNNLEKSKGTKDMVNRAKARGIQVFFIKEVINED